MNANILQYFLTENHKGDISKRLNSLRQVNILCYRLRCGSIENDSIGRILAQFTETALGKQNCYLLFQENCIFILLSILGFLT